MTNLKPDSLAEVIRQIRLSIELNLPPSYGYSKKMIIRPIPTIDFSKCKPERCDHGICIAGKACPHKVFSQEKSYDFPMHNACMCVGCGSCADACPLRAIRMV